MSAEKKLIKLAISTIKNGCKTMSTDIVLSGILECNNLSADGVKRVFEKVEKPLKKFLVDTGVSISTFTDFLEAVKASGAKEVVRAQVSQVVFKLFKKEFLTGGFALLKSVIEAFLEEDLSVELDALGEFLMYKKGLRVSTQTTKEVKELIKAFTGITLEDIEYLLENTTERFIRHVFPNCVAVLKPSSP